MNGAEVAPGASTAMVPSVPPSVSVTRTFSSVTLPVLVTVTEYVITSVIASTIAPAAMLPSAFFTDTTLLASVISAAATIGATALAEAGPVWPEVAVAVFSIEPGLKLLASLVPFESRSACVSVYTSDSGALDASGAKVPTL